MSKAKKGTTLSKETRNKMSVSISGKNHYNYGKHMSAETKLKQSLSKINNLPKKFKDTSIEIKIKEELIKRNIEFKQNYPLENIANVDFYLPIYKTVIECDGCFWHGCPEHNPEWDKRIEKDKTKTEKLVQSGYTVYRFWEHEINKSPKECIDRLILA